MTKQIRVGSVAIGGGAPVIIQSMCNTRTEDAAATVRQIRALEDAGCEIVRVTVPNMDAARALEDIKNAVHIPLVADIHFDYRLAVEAAARGADAIRINPGNIGGEDNIRAVVNECRAHRLPIRIGVNGGSLEKDLLEKHGSATPEALVVSALRHIALLENEGFRDIAVSVKASDVPRTVAAYRLLAAQTDCPLHLGVTEAGTFLPGTVRSAVALGVLLSEGIGDTIRVSLTDTPEREVQVGLEILRALGLRAPGPSVTSCPTCGRTQVDVVRVAAEVEQALAQFAAAHPQARLPRVAVMGCVVNGPGEAREADLALCGGKGECVMYEHGQVAGKVPAAEAAAAVLARLDKITSPPCSGRRGRRA
jgi:(E)-4-hydroxy-3-methylbut-2-enyl-diphosphate synthase